MKHLYIFVMGTRASEYGIGTYVAQLVNCVKKTDMLLTVVKLSAATVREVSVGNRNGVRYILIPEASYGSGNIYDPDYMQALQKSSLFLLREYIRSEDENIFHINYMRCGILAEGLKAAFGGKTVLTVHYTGWSFRLLGDRKKLDCILRAGNKRNADEEEVAEDVRNETEFMSRHADRVIAISRHSYEDILTLYKTNPDKVRLINNALSDRFRSLAGCQRQLIRERYGVGKDEKVLVFAGRLDPVKGISFLAGALKKVLERHPDTRLFVCGDGNYPGVLSDAGPVWSKLSFTGFIPRKVLFELYAIADIGIAPSIHEEFGYVALEMMMHCLPVVANRSTGLTEVVEDGVCGLHVQLRLGKRHYVPSVSDLADKLCFLLDNDVIRKQMGTAARKRYVKKYRINRFGREMTELYNSL